jgi:L-lactate dehydrogenase (cytochrome)
MPVITEIEDLKRIYKRRVPKMFYDYAESGSWTEQTFRDNVRTSTRSACASASPWTWQAARPAAKMVGQDYAMPVALAPVGLCGMQSADGEIKAARAAEKFGVPFTLSTMSICSIEDVAENTEGKPFWFQVYTLQGRRLHETAVRRGRRTPSVRHSSSRSTCRSWVSGTRTSRTAFPRRPSSRRPPSPT